MGSGSASSRCAGPHPRALTARLTLFARRAAGASAFAQLGGDFIRAEACAGGEGHRTRIVCRGRNPRPPITVLVGGCADRLHHSWEPRLEALSTRPRRPCWLIARERPQGYGPLKRYTRPASIPSTAGTRARTRSAQKNP